MGVIRSSVDYTQQLISLLPSGPAWDREEQPALYSLLSAFSEELGRLDWRAFALLAEGFLDSFHEGLLDWERVLGLPDACLLSTGSTADRKSMVVARLVEQGGQTPTFFLEVARRLGYPSATIAEHKAPRFGTSRFGRAYFGTWNAQHMWVLYSGGRVDGGLRFGSAVFGERFGSNPGDILVCVIRRSAPAHSLDYVVFN